MYCDGKEIECKCDRQLRIHDHNKSQIETGKECIVQFHNDKFCLSWFLENQLSWIFSSKLDSKALQIQS